MYYILCVLPKVRYEEHEKYNKETVSLFVVVVLRPLLVETLRSGSGRCHFSLPLPPQPLPPQNAWQVGRVADTVIHTTSDLRGQAPRKYYLNLALVVLRRTWSWLHLVTPGYTWLHLVAPDRLYWLSHLYFLETYCLALCVFLLSPLRIRLFLEGRLKEAWHSSILCTTNVQIVRTVHYRS